MISTVRDIDTTIESIKKELIYCLKKRGLDVREILVEINGEGLSLQLKLYEKVR